MSNKKSMTTLSIAAGTAFVASLAVSNVANAAEGANPFAMNELSGGYMQLAEGKCGEAKCGANKKAEQEAKLLDDLTSGMIETESGLKYKVSKKGSGPNAKIDDVLSVHYSLKLVDGSEIDSSFTRGEPIEFTCGVGQVIKGWDEAMQLLNKGSKATLVIPSELGYGSTGAGNGVIPPNATLIFEVELVDIK